MLLKNLLSHYAQNTLTQICKLHKCIFINIKNVRHNFNIKLFQKNREYSYDVFYKVHYLPGDKLTEMSF